MSARGLYILMAAVFYACAGWMLWDRAPLLALIALAGGVVMSVASAAAH